MQPHNWPTIPLRYVCQLNPSVSMDEFSEYDELTFLPMERIKSGYFVPNVEPFSKYSASYNVFANGDILLAKVTPCFENGNIAIAENLLRGKGFGTSEIFVVRPIGVDGRFLFYYLQSSGFKQEGEASMTGSGGLKRVSPDLLRQHHLPTPTEETQRLIADYLDRETTRIDGLIAEKECMLTLLEEKRAALISHVVTRGLDPHAPHKHSGHKWLGEIPAHWGLQRLKQLAEVRGGLTLGKQYSGEVLAYPYLRVANVQDGYLKLDDVLTVEVPASEAASNLLAFGDVLMNEGGDIDKLGRGCVWREEITPCLHQNHVFAVRPHSVDSDWLALWTSTLDAKRYFESRAKRSTNLASISGSNIKELPVPLPPIDEQRAIQRFLAGRLSRLENIRSELRESLRLLSERRAALITAAVTGQIPLEEMSR
ncbi:restriction endonuclease subunit S [Aeromonas rivipollensis]|uniref:restriction endonuclease subunit S n=1 Tax=Aeromonas rivipollensis TaxID=948519 RepID=UPI00259D570D|nr:restriction endonuclease subunit S [Aeromonas rivipollensis]MDM5057405.1 restriction endonuclease subunit S [Aeromonas rivipollensis]